MDILIRTIAIIIEVIILAAIMYFLLNGVKLILLDFGLRPKYKRFIATALILIGCVVVVFFITHLTTFYPTI